MYVDTRIRFRFYAVGPSFFNGRGYIYRLASSTARNRRLLSLSFAIVIATMLLQSCCRRFAVRPSVISAMPLRAKIQNPSPVFNIAQRVSDSSVFVASLRSLTNVAVIVRIRNDI